MNSAFTLTLLLSLLISAVYCNHEHNHHSNHGDDKWITFVSQIESFWKTETPEKSPDTHTESTLNNKDVFSSGKTTEGGLRKSTDFISNPPMADTIDVKSRTMDNDDYSDVRKNTQLGLIIASIFIIVGLIITATCWCCIVKGCCGMGRKRQEGRVLVTNSNMMQEHPVPQPTQVIVQSPMYQQVPPPQQIVHQYPPPPHMQYGQQMFQQHGEQHSPPPQYSEFPDGGIENPSFFHPSAPFHSTEKH